MIKPKSIYIAKPFIGRAEEQNVIRALREGNLAQGEIVKKFEDAFAGYIGTKYAVAVSSGTAALHLSLLALNLKSTDEVITTSFSFIASANAILYTGAKPVFVDINPQTFTLDPLLIEKKITKHTKAIIPVHLYGLPANMPQILALAKKYKLKVIEDACQAHGAMIKSKLVGSIGDMGCFSFYPTKNMTTGEGGMVTTNSKSIAEKIKLLRSHGMPKRYHHTMLGYNMRMTDIGAAIGVEQLKKLPALNEKRIKNAQMFREKLSGIKGIELPYIPQHYHHVFHQFTIRITSQYPTSRKILVQRFKDNSIFPEVYYPIPIHKQELYKKMGYNVELAQTEKAAKEVLSLPVHPSLKKDEIMKIISVLK